MSENIDTIYNYLVVSEPTNNTATTLDNTSLKFGANLLTTPINTTLSGSGITTPLGSINYAEMFVIRDSVQAVALPIPADGLTFKVVDVVQVANQENPIGATRTNYGYNSISASAGLTVNGLTNFTTCPQTPVVPVNPNDLVNLNYLSANPPPSAVLFYLNNSQTPTPPINTYKLLGILEDNLPQSSINTNISGIGTTQLIQGFANQIINLNAGSFIPSGVWDLNFWASCASASDIGHISVYFQLFGRSALGIEVQIGTDSSLVSIVNTNISQYKSSEALSYTDISAYESLVIKLFAINDRSGTTDITTYFESGASYSHVHTTFGAYVPPSILSLNNIFTGINSFTQPIIGNISGNATTAQSSLFALQSTTAQSSLASVTAQSSLFALQSITAQSSLISTSSTVNNGGSGSMFLALTQGTSGNFPILTNIPTYNATSGVLSCPIFSGSLSGNATTSTQSNTTLSAPDSSLSSNVPLKNGANTFTSINDFTQIINGDITGNAGSATGIATTTNVINSSYTIPFVTSVITTPAQTVYVGVNGPTLNPSTGAITAVGNISTTGNFSGNSATFSSVLSSRIYQDVIQNIVNGQTISFGNGSLLVDTGATALTISLPVLGATSNGWHFCVQKTSATNHNLDINAGAGNQIASLVNVLGASYRLTNGIYQQSFRFINPNWYPY